jgi:monofunctional biosynthetic peptidoglycan transglycosylase
MSRPTLAAPPDERQPRQGFGRSVARRRPGRGPLRRGFQIAAWIVVIGLVLPVPFVIAYRFVPPPITALMIIRSFGGAPRHQQWEPLDHISPNLMRAVVASEDEKFCTHHGFDWQAEQAAFAAWRAGRDPNGASTITMQTAKNLFLWPGRSFVRKGIEAYITVLLEFFWDKHRIIETYLNVIEWGNGVYGAEAAARGFFGKPAAALSPQEAALMAAVLPDPRDWSAVRPTSYLLERAAIIRERMSDMAIPNATSCR